MILAVVAPAGTSTVRLVAVAALTVAFVPLNFTVLLAIVGEKLIPVRVTMVPAVPVVGEKLVRVKGVTGATTVKSLEDVAARLSTSMEIFPVVAPAGTATVKLVAVAADTVATVPLNFTVLSRRVIEKLVPVSVTTVPIGPDVGENPVSVGAVAAGGGIGSSLSLHALHSRKETKLRKSKLCRFLIREMINVEVFTSCERAFILGCLVIVRQKSTLVFPEGTYRLYLVAFIL